jgi:hypothetical protein
MSADINKHLQYMFNVLWCHKTPWNTAIYLRYAVIRSKMLWYSSDFFGPHWTLPLVVSDHQTHVVHLPHVPTTPVEHVRHRGAWQSTFSDFSVIYYGNRTGTFDILWCCMFHLISFLTHVFLMLASWLSFLFRYYFWYLYSVVLLEEENNNRSYYRHVSLYIVLAWL